MERIGKQDEFSLQRTELYGIQTQKIISIQLISIMISYLIKTPLFQLTSYTHIDNFKLILHCLIKIINNIQQQVKKANKRLKMKAIILSQEEYMRKYRTLKQTIELPLKINLYFNFLEASLQDQLGMKPGENFHGFSPLFYPVFCNLSKQEKAFYLYSNMQFIKAQYDKIETTSHRDIANESLNNIKATGQISNTVMSIIYWSKVQISLDSSIRKLKLTTKNRVLTIDLRLYLVRKSKKFQNTFVLQAISQVVSPSDRKISLFFKSSMFDQVYGEIFKCIITFRNQELFSIALEQFHQNQPTMAQMSYIGNNSRSLNFLSSRNVNEFLNFKDKVLKKLLKADFKFQKVYTKQDCKIEQDRNQATSEHNLYKLETTFNCNVQVLKKTFLQKYKLQNFRYIIQSQELEKISNKYSAIYQKLLFQTSIESFKTIEQIIIEELNLKEVTCENEELIFLRGLKGIKLDSFLEFLMIKVKGLGTQNKSKLVIVGSFGKKFHEVNYKTKKRQGLQIEESQEIIIKYLLEFSNMIFRKQTQQQNIQKILSSIRDKSQDEELENQFITVNGDFQNQNREQFVLNTDNEIQENLDEENFKNSISSSAILGLESVAQTYLNNVYQLEPTKQTSEEKLLQKNHFIFQYWCRKPKGGVLCKDEKAVQQQKKVANFLLKSLGKRIFEQKGILNLSLPVTIFRPESHLHSVARNLSFAPLLLEKAVKMDPIERMKLVMIFSLSVTVSSISVSKPFNPVLGQTLQMWIDGCPVYLEQISHHPPVVAYYMIGRGYKVYGNIGPKVSFGFNSITGYAEEPNFVQFDDGTTIQLNFGKMIISGIIIGERTFNFTESMYAIDAKNMLFSQLKFGQEKTSLFSKSSQPQDYFHGRILKTNNEFIQSFYKNSSVTYPTKQNIVEEISKFEGVWNGKIFIDNKQFIDFSKSNGCAIEQQKFPLPSDSSYRKDIKYLKQGSINQAQHEKQVIQNIQRRDLNLRKSNVLE